MKKLKTIICLLCVSALMLSLTGCIEEYLTASKSDVLGKLIQYVDGRTPTSAAVGITFSIDATANDAPVTIPVSMESRIMQSDSTNSYAEGEYKFTVNDAEIVESTQVYNFAQNGMLVTFTHIDSSDRWIRSETPIPESTPVPSATPAPTPAADSEEASPTDFLNQLLKKEAVEFPEEYAQFLLEEETQMLGDAEAYVLTCSLSGEVCSVLLSDSFIPDAMTASLLSDAEGMDFKNLDFSHLTADITVYVNKQTGAPMQADIVLSGTNLLIPDLLPMLPAYTQAAKYHNVTISPIHITLSDLRYEPVTLPTVTEEARILAALSTFTPQQEDGSIVILQQTDAVTFMPQSSWTVTELGIYYAGFRNSDNSQAVHFELYHNTSPEAFFSLVESGMIPAIEAEELVPVAAAADAIGAYQTHSITSENVNVYSACRTVGNSLLGIYVQDTGGADIATVLTPILDTVADYTLKY